MANLLARFAENTFWMARYMERAENVARILDVNETFAANDAGEQEWLPIVQLYADEARFYAVHDEATADNVLHYYLLDRRHPGSVVSAVGFARENARSLRHLISTETWTHLNVFHHRLAQLTRRDLTLSKLSRLCASIKEDCQLHTGIIEGTGYRDEVWYIYQIGKYIERADQTTRVLDINYHRLLPSPADVGSPADASRWNAVLRSVAGYHAFRRIHPSGMQPDMVAELLLLDRRFQRSVALCVDTIGEMCERLGGSVALARAPLDELRRLVGEQTIAGVIAAGLHEFLDRIQLDLIGLTDRLGEALFGHRYERPSG